MITRAEVDNAVGKVVRDLFTLYPNTRDVFIRAAVAKTKEVGTQKARDILRAVLRELYKDAHGGVDPVGRHDFIHWMRDEALRDDADDPIQGVDEGDAFEAVAEDIIP